MGIRAPAGHLARQDAERHGAKTPRRQVLGGAQGRHRETTGSSIRELRGGSCVILAEAAPPLLPSPPRSSCHSSFIVAWLLGQKDKQELGLREAEMTRCQECLNESNISVRSRETQVWLQKIRDSGDKTEKGVMRTYGSTDILPD